MGNYEEVARYHKRRMEEGKRRIQCYISQAAFNAILEYKRDNYLANIGIALDRIIRNNHNIPSTNDNICSLCSGYGLDENGDECNKCNGNGIV
jgi:DnaJ-class molecular chaperone